MDQLNEVLCRLDRFFTTYEELTKTSPTSVTSSAVIQSEQIARLEEKIDGIADWVRRIDQRFAALVDLFEQQGEAEAAQPVKETVAAQD